ncbi:MAG: IS66 family transposase, partial [Pseudomonadota bacterium]
MTDKDVTELPDDPAQLKNVIRQKLAEIRQLEHNLGLALKSQYGPRRERFDAAQSTLFDLGETPDPTSAEEAPAESATKRRKGHGRRRLPQDLPRQRVEHDLPEAEKACPCCGKRRHRIGFDISERLEWKPAEQYVIEHARAKYACPECEENVSVAARFDEPIPRGLGAPGLYAGITVGKYGDHLPLYRLEEILSRGGMTISRSTQCDWMRDLAELSQPVVDRMAERIRQGEIIWTDDTTVPVLDRTQSKTKTGRFWVYIGDRDHRYAVFDYTPNRQRAGPETWLAGWQGYLQADAYVGYNRLVAGDGVTEVACWAHARRKFHEARDSARAAAGAALSRIGQLYRFEKRVGEDDPQARYEQRQKYAKPTLHKFRKWLDGQLPQHLPKSPLGVAMRYTLSNWQALNEYIENGRLTIDNNLSERTIRCV